MPRSTRKPRKAPRAFAVLAACALVAALGVAAVSAAAAGGLITLGTAGDAATATSDAASSAVSDSDASGSSSATITDDTSTDDSAAAGTDAALSTAASSSGTAYAVYSSSDNSLTFSYATSAPSGTAVYSDVGATQYANASAVPWNDYVASITTVVFDSSFASASPVYCRNWFANMTACTTFTDLKYLSTSSVTDMYRMFTKCSSVTSLDLSSWDTSSVTTMRHMFYGCTTLTSITLGESWSTESVERMDYMFYDCQSLEALDVSGWDTSSVVNMAYMFYDCYRLEALDVAEWDVASVEKMMYAFSFCASLEKLDLSGWKTTSLKYMYNLFYGCASLESISFSSGFTTANVAGSYDLRSVFSYCLNLKSLDLSGWNTSGVTNMSGMFNECWSLRTIYVSSSNWSTSAVTASDDMFANCYSLTGGNGTAWASSNAADATYAVIDSTSASGYLTEGSGVASLSIDGTTTCYSTVQAAFAAAASASGTSVTVTLLGNAGEDLTASGGTFTFDLNGYTLTNASGNTLTVAEGASLTVTDSYEATELEGVSSPVTLDYDYADEAVSIEVAAAGGEVFGTLANEGESETYTLASAGTLSITGGVFESESAAASLFGSSSGTVAASAGWFAEQVPNAYCATGYAATLAEEDESSSHCGYYTVAQGTIYFWGGALRITADSSSSSGYLTSSSDIRFAYSYDAIPSEATDVSCGWWWGTSEEQVANQSKSVTSTNTRTAGSYSGDPTDATGTATHLVITGISTSSYYSTAIYQQMWVTYTTADNEEVTIVGDVEQRSVSYIANAILNATDADTTTTEYKYAKALSEAATSSTDE